MTLLKNALIGVLIIVLLFLGIGYFLPSEFKVQRSIDIDAPASEVYSHVADLRAWRNWGVWFERDPNMQVTYSGPEQAVGMKSEWVSEQEGSGEIQIIALEPDKRVVYTLYFPEFEMGSTGELIFREEGGKTRVTWLYYGDVGDNPINHYFALMMDSMIGPDFESGLQNLKVLSEN